MAAGQLDDHCPLQTGGGFPLPCGPFLRSTSATPDGTDGTKRQSASPATAPDEEMVLLGGGVAQTF